MHRQIAAFVEQPGQATFLAAREAVLKLSPLPIVAVELADLERRLLLGEYQAVLDRIDALPPSKVLSPRIHQLAAEAAEALHLADEVELERSLYVLTLRGLLSTGDGSPARPFVVCHPCDEYDILFALGQEPRGQSLAKDACRLCDVIKCTDGSTYWFDVTDLLTRRRAKRRIAGRRQPGSLLAVNRLQRRGYAS
jgi:hypothetical protein